LISRRRGTALTKLPHLSMTGCFHKISSQKSASGNFILSALFLACGSSLNPGPWTLNPKCLAFEIALVLQEFVGEMIVCETSCLLVC
jgi:hypothetical protein